jgi:hypothetical protein
MSTPQLLNWPVNQSLRVSGPPGSLRFPVSMAKVPDATLTQQAVALVNVRTETGVKLQTRSLTLGLGVVANTAQGTARLRLDPGTPPGLYSGNIEIGGLTRPIEINVVEQVKLSIRPSPLVFDRARGLSQIIPVTFENKGNVALTINVSGTYPLGEELPITSSHSGESADAGIEHLTEIFSGLLGSRGRPALREVGKLVLAMPHGEIQLEPGLVQTGFVQMTVPDGLSPSARFRAYVPVYIADLEIAVITATKQPPAPGPKPRTKGATS